MKIINKKIYILLFICSILLSVLSCKKNSVLFPEQIEIEDAGNSEDRGPVKQSSFTVIIETDGLIKFSLANVDKEKVKALFFSYNRDGDKVTTEVTYFDDMYIIKNLPLEEVTGVEVWAIGLNNLESKRFAYLVTPLPNVATVVFRSMNIRSELDAVVLLLSNRSNETVRLFYRIGNVSNFTAVDVPSQSNEVEIFIADLPKGAYTISYYVVDNSGQQSEIGAKDFSTKGYEKIDTNGWEAEASSSASGTNASALIDGDVNTNWQSEPSDDYSEHWVEIYLNQEQLISGIELIRRQDNTVGSFKTFRIEYYSAEISDYVFVDGEFDFNLDTPAAFQRSTFATVKTDYIRIYFTEPINSSINFADLAEINLLEIK